MLIIRDFTEQYISDARALALDNYNEERAFVPALPSMDCVPDLKEFADNGLGVAAFENGVMVGILCCYNPWDGAFDSTVTVRVLCIHHRRIFKAGLNGQKCVIPEFLLQNTKKS